MRINVKQLETGGFSEEKSLAFAFDLDLSEVRQWGQAPYPAPIRIEGGVTSRLGFLTLEYRADFLRHDLCARCLSPVEREQRKSFTHTIQERSGEEGLEPEDVIILPGDGFLELDELMTADLLLDQDAVALCSPECKGICPQCGANRNEEACSCADSRPEPDPRFAALLELLDDSE